MPSARRQHIGEERDAVTLKPHPDRALLVLFNHFVCGLDCRRVGPLAQLRLDKGLGTSTGRGSIRRQAQGGGCGKGCGVSNGLEPGLGGHNGKKIDRADAQHGDRRNGEGEIQGDGAPGLAQKPLQQPMNPTAQAGHHAAVRNNGCSLLADVWPWALQIWNRFSFRTVEADVSRNPRLRTARSGIPVLFCGPGFQPGIDPKVETLDRTGV
jgi:hypothetical protein